MVDIYERDTTGGHPWLDEDEGGGASASEAGGGLEADGGGTDQHDHDHGGHDEGHDRDEHDHGDEHDHVDHNHQDEHDHGEGHDHGDGHGHDRSHNHHAHDLGTVRVGVVTVSSTRSLDDDPSGDAIVEAFEAEGHDITTRELVADDLDGVQGRLDSMVRRDDVDVVVTTGGTGVTPDDVTVEAVRPLFEKELPGFGELFRRRSEADIGTRVVGTRAVGGIADGVPVFCLPGSEAAARLGAEEVVVPEAGHLAGLARRDEETEE